MGITIKLHRPVAEHKPPVAEVGATVAETDVALQETDKRTDDVMKSVNNIRDDIKGMRVEKPNAILREIAQTTKNLLEKIEWYHKEGVEKPDAILVEISETTKSLLQNIEWYHKEGGEKPDAILVEISETTKSLLQTIEWYHKESGDKPDALLGEISETTKSLLETIERHHRESVKEAPLMADYPRSGKKELPVGTTIIHIKEKKVDLPDGTREDIYMAHPVDTCRSFTISTSRQIEIRASMDGTLVYTGSLFTGSQQTHNLAEFDTVEIDTDAVTAFHITMSEDAEGAPSVQPETTAEIQIGYNAAGDIVSLKKVVDGVTYQRDVTDPDVADTTVDRWVVYGAWAVM